MARMTRRAYGQYCGLARALDIVGERWTLLVVRELLPGQKRYSDIQGNLPGVGTSLLADRLRRLEQEGLVERATLPPPAASTVYGLTPAGRDLWQAIRPLIVWGAGRLGKPARGEVVRLEWIMDYIAAGADESRARGLDETYEFRLPPGTFHVRASDGRLTFAEGPADAPAFTLEADLETFVGIGNGAVDPAQAITEGRLTIFGAPEAARNALEILRPVRVPEHA